LRRAGDGRVAVGRERRRAEASIGRTGRRLERRRLRVWEVGRQTAGRRRLVHQYLVVGTDERSRVRAGGVGDIAHRTEIRYVLVRAESFERRIHLDREHAGVLSLRIVVRQ
jgi:hypothetical protein